MRRQPSLHAVQATVTSLQCHCRRSTIFHLARLRGASRSVAETTKPSWKQYVVYQLRVLAFLTACITSLPKVIWEEGRVAALSHTYAVKSPLLTMACPKFGPKSTPSCGPIYLPYPWTRPTYDAKWHPDPIRRFLHNALDRQTDARTDRRIDRPRESLITIGRCATRATRLKTFERRE